MAALAGSVARSSQRVRHHWQRFGEDFSYKADEWIPRESRCNLLGTFVCSYCFLLSCEESRNKHVCVCVCV